MKILSFSMIKIAMYPMKFFRQSVWLNFFEFFTFLKNGKNCKLTDVISSFKTSLMYVGIFVSNV